MRIGFLRVWMALTLAIAGCELFEKDPVGPKDRVRERWMRPQPGAGSSKPVVVGDVVVFGTGDGRLVARRAANGDEVWNVAVAAEGIDGTHLLEKGGVVVAAARRSVHAVDAATGQILWNYVTPVDSVDDVNPRPGIVINASLDADEGTAYVPAWGASVSAVDLRSGAVRWVWRPPAGTPNRTGSMGVRVSGDTLLATVWHFLNASGTRSESFLVALDRATGRELWTVVLPAPGVGVDIQAAPALWGRLALVNTGNGQLFAVDRFTKSVAWQTAVGVPGPGGLNATRSSPIVGGDVVYHDAGTGDLYARRVSDGVLLWKRKYGANFLGDLTVTARRVYGSDLGYLHVFDRKGGRLVGSFQQPRTGDPLIASAPAAIGTQLFVNVNGAAWSFDEP